MLKSRLLSSVAVFAPDDEKGNEGKTPAQIEREKIKVETSKKTEEPELEKEEEKIEEKEEDDDENKDDEGDDEKKEDEEKELTAAEYKKEVDKLKKSVERLQKRVGKTTGEKAAIAQELANAKKSLEAKVEDGQGLSEEEVERRSEIKANEKTANREFNKAVQKIVKSAAKTDAKIETKLTELAQDVAPISGQMIGILEDLDNDNGGAVLAYLANNPDEYEEIYDLAIVKLSNRLNRISDKLAEEAKQKKIAISKVPGAIETIRGGSESPNVLSDKPNKDQASMEKFVKQRQEQELAKRKAKYG